MGILSGEERQEQGGGRRPRTRRGGQTLGERAAGDGTSVEGGAARAWGLVVREEEDG